jgi:hypothetical protein
MDSPQLNYRGRDLELMRENTHVERMQDLLIRVMNHAESMAKRGKLTTTFQTTINEDLEDELIAELRDRHIYAVLSDRDEDGEATGVYMELEEYESENQSEEAKNDESQDDDDNEDQDNQKNASTRVKRCVNVLMIPLFMFFIAQGILMFNKTLQMNGNGGAMNNTMVIQ